MKGRSSVVFSLFAKFNFKLIVVGDKGVGKTSLIIRFVKGVFSKTTNSKGVEFYSSTLDLEGDQIALQLWDTAGSSQYKSMTKSFYQQASCVVLTYCNPTNLKDTIESYILQINEMAQEAIQIVIARTKTDLIPITKEQQQILNQLVERQDNILMWMSVCSKTGQNVQNFFKTVGKTLFAKYHQDSSFKQLVDPKKDSFMLEQKKDENKRNKDKSCCH